MSDQITLTAQPRTITGKKVRHLRAQGLIPAVIYGTNVEAPVHIQIPHDELRASLRAAGGTNLIVLTVNGQPHNVLVRDVQRGHLRGELLHVDFHAVSLTTRITVDVPVTLIGQSEIIRNGQAMLITNANTVPVHCLPTNIPHEVTLDLSQLVEIGDFLTVADLKIPAGVTVAIEPEVELVRTDFATRLEEPSEEEMAAEAGEVEVIKRGKVEEEE